MRVQSLAAIVGCLVGLLPAQALAQADGLSGFWVATQSVSAIKTISGQRPPLKPDALKDYKARIEARAKGHPIADSTTYCQPDGVPRILYAMKPFQILETPGQVTFLYEKGHNVRIVRLDRALPKDVDPTFLGYSTGQLQNEELVVQSAGFNTATTLDAAGLPHSENLHVTEDYKLSKTGDRLTATIKIDDPDTYTHPWSTKLTFKRLPGHRMQEDICQLTNPAFKGYFTEN